jgi:hypothetical protein
MLRKVATNRKQIVKIRREVKLRLFLGKNISTLILALVYGCLTPKGSHKPRGERI